jgi:hypothetical protein
MTRLINRKLRPSDAYDFARQYGTPAQIQAITLQNIDNPESHKTRTDRNRANY